ncbi:hypothetical protein EEL31_09160 [Brevibacillus laterosporus]|nr:hypothetical protein [Brevibacillus laterosporus]TPG68675.1 hypothetical protein EEL31_09160 [Brevibacillus laterosporus]
MKTIYLELNKEYIPCEGTFKDDWGIVKQFDGIRVKSFSGQRVYLSAIKNSMNLKEIIKKMCFKNGNAYVSIGKNKVKIGEYK